MRNGILSCQNMLLVFIISQCHEIKKRALGHPSNKQLLSVARVRVIESDESFQSINDRKARRGFLPPN